MSDLSRNAHGDAGGSVIEMNGSCRSLISILPPAIRCASERTECANDKGQTLLVRIRLRVKAGISS